MLRRRIEQRLVDWKNKGAIFENSVADLLSKAGRKLYYFHKDSGLEIDFVIRQNNQSVLLQVSR